MDASLLAAYENTDFWVDVDDGRFKLRVGEYSPELDALQELKGIRSSAFITAWNPRSKPMSRSRNDAAQEALYADICALELECIDGIGEDPSGNWSGEPSFLVLGICENDCIMLGKRFGQNAVVFSGPDAVPYLVFPFCTGHV